MCGSAAIFKFFDALSPDTFVSGLFCHFYPSGSVTVMVVPLPGVLWSVTLPPW